MAEDSNKQANKKISAASTVREVDAEVERQSKEIRNLYKSKALLNKTDRYLRKMEAAIAVQYVPFEKKERLWEEIRAGLIEDQSKGRLTVEDLNITMEMVNKDILGRMNEIVELAKSYIEALVKACPHGRLSSQALLKMVKSEHLSITKFTALMLEKHSTFDGLKMAVKWAMGTQEKSEESGIRTAESMKPAAFEELTKQFDENRNNERYVRYAWHVISLVNTATRVEFGIHYLESKSSGEAMEFLEDGNKRGVFSPREMEQILKGTNNMAAVSSKFEGQRKKYETLWEVQNVFREEVAKLDHENYQGGLGKNGHTLVENTITGKNGLMEGGFIVAVGSLVGNFIQPFFKGGSLNINMEALKTAVTKKYTLISSAIIGARYLKKKNKEIPVLDNVLTAETERESQKRASLMQKLKDSNGSRWGRFFEKEDYEGVYQLSKWIDMFRDSEGKVGQSRLVFQDFKNYIKSKSPTLFSEIGKIGKDNQEFRDICNALDMAKIGGEKARVISKFKEEINNAENA